MLVTPQTVPLEPVHKRQPILNLVCTSYQCDYASKRPGLKIPPKVISQKYTVSQLLQWKHDIKIDDDALRKYNQEIQSRIEFCQSFEKSVSHPFAPPDNKLLVFIQQNLNKLSENNFDVIVDAFKELPELGNEEFIQLFAESVMRVGSMQLTFSELYARFTHSILALIEDSKSLIQAIENIAFDIEYSKSDTTARFIGELTQISILQLPDTCDYGFFLLESGNYEALAQLCTPILEKLNLELDEGQKLLSEMKKISTDTTTPMRIRFLLSDLLDTLPKEQKSPGDQILEEWLTDHRVRAYWSTRLTRELFIALVNTQQFDEGVQIFTALKGMVKDRELIRVINETTEIEGAQVRTGRIFANLINFNLLMLPLFGIAIKFDLKLFFGLLYEMKRLNIVDRLNSSPWMKNLEFIPDISGYLPIINIVQQSGLRGVWPIFDAIITIFDSMNNGDRPKELEVPTDPEIYKTQLFAEIITEIIVMCKPEVYARKLAKYIMDFIEPCLDHIVKLGECYHWKPEETAREVRGLANGVKYDLKDWKAADKGESHARVASLIP